jgi:hypothetical protein
MALNIQSAIDQAKHSSQEPRQAPPPVRQLATLPGSWSKVGAMIVAWNVACGSSSNVAADARSTQEAGDDVSTAGPEAEGGGGGDASLGDHDSGGAIGDGANPGDAPGFDPYGGASGCDRSVQVGSHSCELMMPLSGGLSGTLAIATYYGCGWANGPPPMSEPLNFGLNAPGPPPWNGTSVRFDPSSPIVPGQTGTLANAAVSLWVMGDAGSVTWTTPASCILDLTSNACAPSASIPNLYVVSGTGSCSQPAQPNKGSFAPVTIGNFFFATEFQGPSSDQ